MSPFWFRLLYLIVVWGFAVYSKADLVRLNSATFLLSALFFLLYFVFPLVQQRKWLAPMIIFLLTAITFFNFWSVAFNGFIFLILLVIAIQTMEHLQGLTRYLLVFLQYAIVVLPPMIAADFQSLMYINLTVLLVGFGMYFLQHTQTSHALLEATHDILQKDYRRLKRQVVIHEKAVRQEERNQIAREIHDSVGHRLTALLMQLEVVRLQTTDESELKKITQLKSLAQISLTETREAVKALKSEETTGLTAVIQLIRKLEAESHLQITFQIKAGAFSFPLTAQQSVVLYRSVQEGLTNMMRHSDSRQAEIEFKIVGGSFFGFQITNPLQEKVEIVEGFGLTAMRERIEQLGGTLNISQSEGGFTLTGTFPMEKGDD